MPAHSHSHMQHYLRLVNKQDILVISSFHFVFVFIVFGALWEMWRPVPDSARTERLGRDIAGRVPPVRWWTKLEKGGRSGGDCVAV